MVFLWCPWCVTHVADKLMNMILLNGSNKDPQLFSGLFSHIVVRKHRHLWTTLRRHASIVSNTRENDQWSGLGQEFLNLQRSRNPYREENSQPYNLNKQLKVHQCSNVTVFYSKMF